MSKLKHNIKDIHVWHMGTSRTLYTCYMCCIYKIQTLQHTPGVLYEILVMCSVMDPHPPPLPNQAVTTHAVSKQTNDIS